MTQQKQPQAETETITITNFSGRLTRLLNGEMNSGFAKFAPSFGYDPFSKPMNLTWLEKPVDITGPTGGGLMVAAKPRTEGLTQYIYGINSAGNLYKIQPASVNAGTPNLDSVIAISSVKSGNPSYLYGASMDFFGSTEKIYITNDSGMNSINFDGSADTEVGVDGRYASNTFHPLRQFIGKLIFGNGNTIGAVSATATVTSSIIGTGQGNLYSEINPPLPTEAYVRDLDVSPDGNYALITASNIVNEQILTAGSDSPSGASSDGYIYKWNGTDAGITTSNTIPSYAVTALQTYLSNNLFFSDDSFGSALNNGDDKLLTLPGNKSPLPNSTLINGNFVVWIAPELSASGTSINASMYYFGSLDQENPSGLYRVMRMTPILAGGFVYQTPLNLLTNNKYSAVNSARTAVATGSLGKHYFSVMEVNSASAGTFYLYRFLITPSGSGTPQLGVYETQNQLFSKRIGVAQVRVYCEPTVAGNAFQLDLIGGDGTIIDNGSFTYSFGSVVDPSTNSPVMERINFNPGTKTLFSLGIRITNTGTTNMTIKKIEIDYAQEGK